MHLNNYLVISGKYRTYHLYLLRAKPFRLINPSGFEAMDGFPLTTMCGKD
jgi:hypothetical protein